MVGTSTMLGSGPMIITCGGQSVETTVDEYQEHVFQAHSTAGVKSSGAAGTASANTAPLFVARTGIVAASRERAVETIWNEADPPSHQTALGTRRNWLAWCNALCQVARQVQTALRWTGLFSTGSPMGAGAPTGAERKMGGSLIAISCGKHRPRTMPNARNGMYGTLMAPSSSR